MKKVVDTPPTKITLLKTLMANHERKRSLLLPYGHSIFPKIAQVDPMSNLYQTCCLVFTVVALATLPFLPTLIANYLGVASWSEEISFSALPMLLCSALELDPEIMENAFKLTCILLSTLVVMDFLGCTWPKSWNTDNTQCYDEMFCEPTRKGALIRRPGNVLSNFFYLYGSMCVLASSTTADDSTRLFRQSDLLFGVMLFILGILSIIWHASNAPKSQYIDLWSMDSCIGYLLLRFVCMAVVSLNWISSSAASTLCLGLYLLLIAANGRHQLNWSAKKFLEKGCVFSGRHRLLAQLQREKKDAKGETVRAMGGEMIGDVSIVAVCLFLSMPVLYMIVPFLLQLFILRAVGSVPLATLSSATLVIGWTLRIWERFCLDGNNVMNYVVDRKKKSSSQIMVWFWTVCAGLVSPTAHLHLWTGLTLLAGYAHARTVDVELLASQGGV